MKKLFKRAPQQDYESSYEVSDALIRHISEHTHETWSKVAPMTPIQLAVFLAGGGVLMLGSPFSEKGEDVQWSMEEADEN